MIVECVKCKLQRIQTYNEQRQDTLGKSRWQKDEELQKNQQAKGLKTNRDNIM